MLILEVYLAYTNVETPSKTTWKNPSAKVSSRRDKISYVAHVIKGMTLDKHMETRRTV